MCTTGSLGPNRTAVLDGAAERSKGDNPRKLPKGNKTRVTLVGSVTGYPIGDKLLERVEAAGRERTAKTNPEALLVKNRYYNAGAEHRASAAQRYR